LFAFKLDHIQIYGSELPLGHTGLDVGKLLSTVQIQAKEKTDFAWALRLAGDGSRVMDQESVPGLTPSI
jgi:hypothetical protein